MKMKPSCTSSKVCFLKLQRRRKRWIRISR